MYVVRSIETGRFIRRSKDSTLMIAIALELFNSGVAVSVDKF